MGFVLSAIEIRPNHLLTGHYWVELQAAVHNQIIKTNLKVE